MWQAIIDTIMNVVGAVIDFIFSIVQFLLDTVLLIFDFVWRIFTWIKNETYAIIWNLVKGLFDSLNFDFPIAMVDEIYYWYHQINNFFPIDSALDIAFVLFSTWMILIAIKIGFKVKLKIGGLITQGLFK